MDIHNAAQDPGNISKKEKPIAAADDLLLPNPAALGFTFSRYPNGKFPETERKWIKRMPLKIKLSSCGTFSYKVNLPGGK